MADCLSNCIYQRRTVVTDVTINYPRSSTNPDTCKWTDAVKTAVDEKVKRKYQKTENGSCSGDCHCVQDVDAEGKPKKEEGPVKDTQSFDTVVKIDECTYTVHGTYTTESYDTPGRCLPNGGLIKISAGQIPDSDITIVLDNYDNLSRETLAQIGEILRKPDSGDE